MSHTVLIVFGTRPEAIKLAPVIHRLREHPDLDPVVCVTAQHREMLDQVLDLFAIVPDFDLDIMLPRQSLADVTTRALTGLAPVVEDVGPDATLVQGDTTTTFVAALASFYHKVPVGHVEAGLRTDDVYQPFPEEINRRLTSTIARWHFAPTGIAEARLFGEGVPAERVHVTGNTVIDALLDAVSHEYRFPEGPVRDALESGRRIVLLTSHRRENWGEPIRSICEAAKALVERFSDVHVLFSVHMNPVVQETAREVCGGLSRVELMAPVDYLPFVKMMHAAHLILTDSGGMQEEAPSLGKPVLVLRNVTERPEAVHAGTAKVVGTEAETILREASRLLTDSDAYDEMAKTANPFGDGHASERIADVLARELDGARA